jgi:hypothetical protein
MENCQPDLAGPPDGSWAPPRRTCEGGPWHLEEKLCEHLRQVLLWKGFICNTIGQGLMQAGLKMQCDAWARRRLLREVRRRLE